MKHLLRYFCALVLLLSFASCNDDDEYVYPSVKLEFLSAYADGNGAIQKAVCDDGIEWTVIEDKSGSKFEANSSKRFIANMEQLEDHKAIIYSLLEVVCVNPLPAESEEFKDGIITKPVEMVSIWQGLSYINMVLSVKTHNSKHSFHFVEEQYTMDSDGNATVRVLLYHNSDIEEGYNTKRAYASIPIAQYMSVTCKQANIYFDYYGEDGERKECGPFIFKQ